MLEYSRRHWNNGSSVFAPVTLESASFAVVIFASVILAVVTLESASFAVVTPESEILAVVTLESAREVVEIVDACQFVPFEFSTLPLVPGATPASVLLLDNTGIVFAVMSLRLIVPVSVGLARFGLIIVESGGTL